MKKVVLKAGLSTLLAMNLFFAGDIILPVQGISFAAEAQKAPAETQVIKGKITNISQKAKTIALENKDNSFFILKFSDDTILKGAESATDFDVDEAISVHYTTVNGENLAISLEKAIVKLPDGVTEIKTDELVKQIETNKNLVIIDARPPIVYAEGHLAGAVSIPLSKLAKMGDDGAQLLDKYKDKQLVFYCGGPT
ncbi:rhodanese-like domain-containing protein [Desulforhopalus sp. IMCC35007]|uniref:rhodanese-like domain-containing protein n=1 Tax=Desulforhopalus sp. IMCC35007 TaxID=2569543 RepID=UPI0010AEC09E|nr:rhodanese-like domain-containing protein [Desulforhopalus sp. IMCC35007]TKB06609.1 rhodanese-like domain-containing protein [Desulforhopalus sp. IMCC35007]